MNLHIRHTFPCAPAMFWEMYWDASYDAMLREGSDVQRELLEERREGDMVIRRTRFVPEAELPVPVAKLVGSKRLVYEMENRWDPEAGEVAWKLLPTLLPDRLHAAGSFRVRPVPEGCEQVVEGDIRVDLRFIGGRVEKLVVEQVQHGYDRAAEIGRRWLAQR